MYSNQIYLGSGNYGFEAASEYYFSKPLGQLTLPEAATLAAIIRGPIYSPITHPDRARARRNLVLSLMAHSGKITQQQATAAGKQPLGLHIQSLRNDLAPYFVEEIRQYLEHTYGTAAVHEQGLRAYTTLNVAMQKAADQAVRDGLHEYDRRHGWRGKLPNILRDHPGTLDSYQNDDWRAPIQKGDYVTGLVTSVQPTFAWIKIGHLSRVPDSRRFLVDRPQVGNGAAEAGRSGYGEDQGIDRYLGAGGARSSAVGAGSADCHR